MSERSRARLGRRSRRTTKAAVCSARVANAAGLLAGFALDVLFGDPRRLHPVAGFGRWATAVERQVYAPTRSAGIRYTAVAAGAPVVAAAAASYLTRHRPAVRAALVAATTWAVLGGRSLRREAQMMAASLEQDDIAAARRRLPNLCGREPSGLDASELARATVESVAENTSDAVVAPLFWGSVAGLPGLVGYRAVNTLDAMVGHRNSRYRNFGTASARADDIANLIPSRLTALLTCLAAPMVGGSPIRALRTWLRDGGKHPSPNAGQCEAAMAGALAVRLGGRNVYFGHTEDRPTLGTGPRPGPDDIRRASRLSRVVGLSALAVCVAAALRPARSRA